MERNKYKNLNSNKMYIKLLVHLSQKFYLIFLANLNLTTKMKLFL